MLGHYKVSGKPAGANATLVGGPDWDTEHEFDGDATGGLLVRDSAQPFGAGWITGVATGRVLVSGGVGVRPAWSAAPSLTSLTLSTPLAAGSGGTGFASYAVGDLLYASGAAALSKLADVATGQVLVSGGVGVAPAWSAAPSLTSLTLSTPLAAGSGGTGFASYAVGDLLYASGAAALSKLADVAAGSVLVSGGVTTAPAWSANPTLTSLTLSTPLAGGSGGTGISSYAVGDLLYASGAAALSKLADVAAGAVLVSGGVTTAPAWSVNPSVTTLVLGGDVTLSRSAAGKLTIAGTTPTLQLGGSTSSFPALRQESTTQIGVVLADASAYAVIRAAGLSMANGVLVSGTAPTISSGFGTSPSIGNSNSTAAFTVVVGTSPGSSGVLTLPAAANGWNCSVTNLTAAAAHRADNTVQTASTTTTVTLENQTKSTGAAIAWTAGDVLRVSCFAY